MLDCLVGLVQRLGLVDKNLRVGVMTDVICSSVADPVHFFGSGSTDQVFKKRILIRVTQKRPDPDPT